MLALWVVACDRREPEPLPDLGPDDDFCNTISYACLEGSRTDTADGCPDFGGPPAIDFAADASALDAAGERVLEDVARDVPAPRASSLGPGSRPCAPGCAREASRLDGSPPTARPRATSTEHPS